MEKNNTKILSGKLIQTIVFGGLLILLFLLVCRMIAPFFTVFLWSILLYIIINPLHKKIVKKIKPNTKWNGFIRTVLAGAFALGSVLIVFIPLLIVVTQLYIQGIEVVKNIREYLFNNKETLNVIYEKIADFIATKTNGEIVIDPVKIQTRVIVFLESELNNILHISGVIIRGAGLFLLGLVLIVFCLFFFYLDAPYLSKLVTNIIPIKNGYTKTLVNKFKEIAHGLVLGYLSVALIQATLAFIVFSIFRVQGALVFACLTFVCVFIPMLGGALVWLPIGLARILSGDIFGGILLTCVAGVCISLLDNILRPFLLKDRLQLHPLVIFFAIMGGLVLFGFNGLILGPLVTVFFLTVLEMFFKEHHINKAKITTIEGNNSEHSK